MSPYAFLPAMLAIAICAVPVWLLRRSARDRTEPTRLEVVRNASIAYALRLAALGPLFAWGVQGDWWPAVVVAVSLPLGILLIYALREPLVAFVDAALRENRSFTIHAFLAHRHGDDARVQRLAARLTIAACIGLVAAEALVVAMLLNAILPGSRAIVGLVAAATVLIAALHALPAGHSGVLHAAQWQLAMLQLGLYGSMALFLYLHVSARTPLALHGTLVLSATVAWCASILYLTRSRYVDTASSARVMTRLGKTLNALLSVLVGFTLVIAIMDLYAADASAAGALSFTPRMPTLALIALGLLALLHPLVDVVSWQRLATIRADTKPDALRRYFHACAGRTAFLLLLVWLAAAVAALAAGTESLEALLRRDSETAIALPLLLVALFAAALSTMSALCSGVLCTIRDDLAPAHRAMPGRGALAIGAAALVSGSAAMWSSGDALLVLLLGSGCLQLCFWPLAVGGRRLRSGAALATLAAGAAAGVGAVVSCLVFGAETWLWAAVPACLGTGWLVSLAVSRRK